MNARHLPRYLTVKYTEKEPEELGWQETYKVLKRMTLREPGAKVHSPHNIAIWNLILSTYF